MVKNNQEDETRQTTILSSVKIKKSLSDKLREGLSKLSDSVFDYRLKVEPLLLPK
jgi:hypothetical protein